MFPKAFQSLRLQDLGSAGYDGFDRKNESTGVNQVRFVKGRHGAALSEDNWDDIARFIVHGEAPDLAHFPHKRSLPAKLLGWLWPLGWLGIICLVALGFVIPILLIRDPTIRTVAIGTWLIFVLWVLTKF